jgi:hypothetical protein
MAVDVAASPMYGRTNEAGSGRTQARGQSLLAAEIEADDLAASDVQPTPPKLQFTRSGEEPDRQPRHVSK